jgi:hypothetical protein
MSAHLGTRCFTWAYTLSRAYHLTGKRTLCSGFLAVHGDFPEGKPDKPGPKLDSAQEVALRLIALTFAIQVFSSASSATPERVQLLVQAIADHAAHPQHSGMHVPKTTITC